MDLKYCSLFWNALGVISNDASTVGAYELDLVSSNDSVNPVVDMIKQNKSEIIFLFGQDKLSFNKKKRVYSLYWKSWR